MFPIVQYTKCPSSRNLATKVKSKFVTSQNLMKNVFSCPCTTCADICEFGKFGSKCSMILLYPRSFDYSSYYLDCYFIENKKDFSKPNYIQYSSEDCYRYINSFTNNDIVRPSIIFHKRVWMSLECFIELLQKHIIRATLENILI